jgi:putative membrane-bound dehydrogenase-like protein
VEVVLADTKDVIFQARGLDKEEMRPVAVDLREVVGREIYLRVVDQVGTSWGHINFDHFRFHDSQPQVPDAPEVEMRPDQYRYANLPAHQAAQAMKLPPGFSATVFAAEPDVQQPIAMALDDRGRVWIAEAYEYPQRAAEGKGRDRILVFEDTDGDGRFDKRTVFAEGVNLVSGLEVGFGGVWVGAAPNLLFIADRDGDDVPDGEPEVLLDGWGYQDTHETLNSFMWGPDGWLYGCHGVFTHSHVGRPGTPDAERIPLNAGIWRYHPTKHVFEVFASGTSNPWGIDFNDHGQAVITACVIPHLYHVIQGGRYQRQAGAHFNPHTYDDIKTIADHLHYLGESPWSGNDRSGQAGGGHAHAGAMIYLGGAWPNRYREQIFMNNIHGQRINLDILYPRGSGLVGSHAPDFLLTQDRASQMLNFRYGPDGQVYVIDWYDMQACHVPNASLHDRSNGRIYKLSYGQPRFTPVDLRKLSDRELVEHTLSNNDWYVRHARRILQERAAAGTLDSAVGVRLADIATTHPFESRRLRAAWALHVIGALTPEVTDKLLADRNEYVRAWAIQLALDTPQPNLQKLLPRFEAMAQGDPSPVARLYLASALQRLPVEQRWTIVERLAQHAEDASDHNLPLMLWYAAEPLAEADSERALALALQSGKTMPQIRDFMLRRLASLDSTASMAALVHALGDSSDSEEQLKILRGIRRALQGQRHVQVPPGWIEVYDNIVRSGNEEVRTQATALGVTFGDQSAMDGLHHLVMSSQATTAARREALEVLLAAKDPGLVPTLQLLLKEPDLRDTALSGLALYDDPLTPDAILAVYGEMPLETKRRALATLTSRATYGKQLLHAVADKRLPISDLPADLVRQLHNLQDQEIDQLLSELWGTIRSTAADKAELIAKYRQLLTAPTAAQADPELGRAVFAKTCQQCHTLYGVGDTIGPDLTGSNRSDVDYLLSNVIDPSALIAKEYQSTVIITMNGRLVTGVVSAEDDKVVTIRTATDTIVMPKEEIDERYLGDTSMMPEGQLTQFSEHEIVSLGAYLMGKSQVPILATQENAGLLFNDRDLTGWHGDPQFWTVEDGEIVGRSAGLDHNTFLVSDLSAKDFQLTFEVKLADNRGNSGVQFRSKPLKGYEELQGYQADIGSGWWGKLYEENGRELLWDQSGEQHVAIGEWNKYEIRAEGDHIRTWINGQLCVDLEDADGNRQGVFALQLHAGEPMEVRYRNLKLDVLTPGSPSD